MLAAYALSSWASSCFDDKNLAELGAGLPQGALLYVWSPRMVLSAQHAASAQRQAQQLGLAFVPLHDAQVAAGEVQAALARLAQGDAQHTQSVHALARSQSLCAASLLERDALRHFPTALVMHPGGQVHRHAIIGAMPEAAWAQSIAQRKPAGMAP